ncbi:MAG: DUF2750 domain-containing protein [Aeromonadales bacterium]|nr:DUF2750 domain-containing protein [Aeromonadales bacterium]
MSELTDKEFEAILSLNAEYRQAMFDRVVAEKEGLYILADEEGPLILEDTEEDENNNLFSIIPVWSDERLATAWAKESGNESMKAQFITKKAWNESWVPMLKEQKNVLLGIMPVAEKDFSVEDLECI